jgi:hypothetical protein
MQSPAAYTAYTLKYNSPQKIIDMSAQNTFAIRRSEVINTTENVPLPAYYASLEGNFFKAIFSDRAMIHVCTFSTYAQACIQPAYVNSSDKPCTKAEFDKAFDAATLELEDARAALSVQPAQPLESFLRESISSPAAIM